MTKSNDVSVVSPSQSLVYTIVVGNDGPDEASTADVTDDFPVELADPEWTCTADGSAFCSASGTGTIVDAVYLPAGDAVTYTVTCTVDPDQVVIDETVITNEASVAVAGAYEDPDLDDNTAIDSDPVDDSLIFQDGFESGDFSRWSGVVN